MCILIIIIIMLLNPLTTKIPLISDIFQLRMCADIIYYFDYLNKTS